MLCTQQSLSKSAAKVCNLGGGGVRSWKKKIKIMLKKNIVASFFDTHVFCIDTIRELNIEPVLKLPDIILI